MPTVSTLNNITEGPSAPPPDPLMAEYKAGPRRRKPTHPGAIVKSNIEALGASVNAVALAIGVTRAALGKVVAEKSAISPEMALRLGTFFGNGPQVWIGMQVDHDLWEAETRIRAEIARIKPAEWDREEIEE